MQNLARLSRNLSGAATAIESNRGEVSRRSLLAGMGTLAGIAAAATTFSAEPPTFGRTNVKHRLLRRISYGVTVLDQNRIARMSYSRILEEQLNPSRIDDTECQNALQSRYPRVFMSVGQLGAISDDWITVQQLGEATIYRAAFSKRQLLERMVEFWSDHFNVNIDKTGGWLFTEMHNAAIRQHALGKFPDMLKAVAHSPAMLYYLDNPDNYGDFGNINYARELLELHSLSPASGYTAADIRNVARCFSGWEFQWNSGSPDYGQFLFDEDKHSNLPKTFMGRNVPPGGQSEGEWILDFLGKHVSTARFISKKLCKFFYGYEPPNSLVEVVAKRYLATGGDIRAMLRLILTSQRMSSAPWKLKRPYHLIINGLRNMDADIEPDMWTLRYDFIDRAGNLPFFWEPPDGYPDRVDYWANLLLPRWNFALSLPKDYVWGVKVESIALMAGANTPTLVANRINKLLFCGEMNAQNLADLKTFLAAGTLDEERIEGALALAMASPSFQWF